MKTKLVWRDDVHPRIGALCRWKDLKSHVWEYGYKVPADGHGCVWTFAHEAGGTPVCWMWARPNILEVAVVEMQRAIMDGDANADDS